MKIIGLIVFWLLCLTSEANLSVQHDDVCGKWYTENNASIIEILKGDDGMFIGRIIWLEEPNETDKSNPNYGKPVRDKYTKKPLLGSLVIFELKYNGINAWEDGFVYDCRKGKKYNCSIQLSEDKNTLNLTGYLKTKILGKTVVWKRVV